MPFFEVSDGTRLNYVDWGSGRNPILFLHGRGFSLRFYDYQLAELAKDHRVLAYDLRGHGESDKPNSNYDHAEFARDLREFIDGLGLDRVNLVGTSTGSFVLQKYATVYGLDGVSTLSLVSTTPVFVRKEGFPYAPPARKLDAVRASLNRDYPKAVMDFLNFLFYRRPRAHTLAWLFGLEVRTPLYVLLKTLDANVSMDYRNDLKKIDRPALIAQGRHDRLCPLGAAKFMHERIRQSKLVVFERSGHLPYIEESLRFAEEVKRFVSSNS